MKSRTKYGLILGLATTVMICGLALAASAGGPPTLPPDQITILVTSTGLYYDSILLGDLPNKGPFQKLSAGVTEFGPGDPGYRGGRWWVDDGDGIRGDEDMVFLCPLLPPGRLTLAP